MNENNCAGLTATGFKRKSFEDITNDITKDLKAAFGPINCEPSSVLGQFNAVHAKLAAELWEKSADVYHSQFVSTAEGVSLDLACAGNGIKRLVATHTKVLCQLTAINYTTIPKGSEVFIESSDNLFALAETITITNEKCQSISLKVNPTVNDYKLYLNNHKVVVECKDGLSIDEAVLHIIEKINELEVGIKAQLVDDNIVISSIEITKNFSCFTDEGITIVDVTNNAIFKAKSSGSIIAPSFAVNSIQTPVQGWIGISNINAGITGRELETDSNLRKRYALSIKKSGSGTLEAIRARLLDIKGVSFATVVDNTTDKPDCEGRPANSFEALVLGGSDLNIAQTIWQVRPAGIQPWGNKSVIIRDSTDRSQCIRFSRPIMRFIYVKLNLKVFENFKPENLDVIKQALVLQINDLELGNNLIYQSLFAAVYSVAGILDADLNVGATNLEENLPDLKCLSIEAKASEKFTTDSSKIEIKII